MKKKIDKQIIPLMEVGCREICVNVPYILDF